MTNGNEPAFSKAAAFSPNGVIYDNISGNHNEPCVIHSPEMNGICMVCKEKIFTPTT